MAAMLSPCAGSSLKDCDWTHYRQPAPTHWHFFFETNHRIAQKDVVVFQILGIDYQGPNNQREHFRELPI
jgi:hypothetical protein